MKYDPKKARPKPWPASDYRGKLQVVTVTESKGGDGMWKLEWSVQVGEKTFRKNDYIVNNDSCLWKLAKLAAALGKKAEFESGTFQPDECIGCEVLLVITIRESEERGKENSISGYKALKKFPTSNGSANPPVPTSSVPTRTEIGDEPEEQPEPTYSSDSDDDREF